MRFIGITGGVGAGKSAILSYIKEHYNCTIILADEVAHIVKEPGQKCYEQLVDLLGKNILDDTGKIDKAKMAEKIFSDDTLLEQVNHIIHPAVKEFILNCMEIEKMENKHDFMFVEAALLIEEGYDKILDELWYIYADEKVRMKRLMESRHYSEEKVWQIFKSQLSEQAFRAHCKVVIDNSGFVEEAYKQIDNRLEEYLWQK